MVDTRTDIGAVLISYNPSAELVANAAALLQQIPAVTVVDNGSSPASAGVLAQIEAMPGCSLIRLGSNRGVAAALNIGVDRVLSGGCRFVFTFDQDSSIEPGFVSAMLRCAQEAPDPAKLGMVAAIVVDREHKFQLKLPRSRSGELLQAITSGTLVPASTFAAIGYFDEELFIDYVDTEFCLRARHAGLRIVECTSAILHHSIGSPAPRRFLGMRCYPSNHSPQRRYYIFRNRTFLVMKYSADLQWVLLQFHAAAKERLKLIFLEKGRLSKLSAVVRGVGDGLGGRMGKRVEL